MSYRYERYHERPPRKGRRGLLALTVIVWMLVLGCLGARYLLRPAVTDYVNRQVAVALDPEVPADRNPGDALQESLEQVQIPFEIPAGTRTITEQEANRFVAAYESRLSGVDDVRVRFVPGQVQADITVRGFTGTATMEPAVQNGQLVATNTSLGQPLGSFLSIDPLMQALLDRVNGEVTAQGRTITRVQVEQGQAVITVE